MHDLITHLWPRFFATHGEIQRACFAASGADLLSIPTGSPAARGRLRVLLQRPHLYGDVAHLARMIRSRKVPSACSVSLAWQRPGT